VPEVSAGGREDFPRAAAIKGVGLLMAQCNLKQKLGAIASASQAMVLMKIVSGRPERTRRL